MPKTLDKKAFCLQCKRVIPQDRKFCSRECKAKSQVKRIILVCSGCKKQFSVRPYLQRKSNYCSIKCYLDSSHRKEKRICKICQKEFSVKRYLVRQGFGIYCSKTCQFESYPKRIGKACLQCGKEIKVQPAKIDKTKFCSKKCKDSFERNYTLSVCRKCGEKFELPMSDLNRGRGNFCSYRCFLTYRGPSTLEEKMERSLRFAGINFDREVKFKRFHADFLIKKAKTVIECDGEYWHTGFEKEERDKRKEEFLKSLGYRVLRFSGRSINKFSERDLAQKVLDVI